MSDCCPYTSLDSTSGAINSDVPIGGVFCVRLSSLVMCAARPKSMSVTLRGEALDTMTF